MHALTYSQVSLHASPDLPPNFIEHKLRISKKKYVLGVVELMQQRAQ